MTKCAAELQEFREELAGFARQAEQVLDEVDADPAQRSGKLHLFAEWMLTIRGTSEQLGIPNVAEVARLGEEIAAKAVTARSSHQRKATAALWDVVTTVKVLLAVSEGTPSGLSEEERILTNRLQATLKSLGGAREHVSSDSDLEDLFKTYRS
jgi:hypothetical protein